MSWPDQSPVLVSRTKLTSAQVLTLFSTPVTLIPAVTGMFIRPLQITLNYNFVTTAYNATAGNIVVKNTGGTWHTTAAAGFWNQTSSQISSRTVSAYGASVTNATTALQISEDTANPTTGDGTLTVTVHYVLIPVS